MINPLLNKIFPVFPLAIASNLFSVTALMIFFGVTGNSALAAEIGVIQGAALSIFLAFSGNARNLILSKSNNISLGQLIRFRAVFVLPFGGLVYLLCQSFVEVTGFLAIVLTVRRCTEWIAELIITDREYREDHSFAGRYILLQVASFATLLLHGIVSSEVYNTFLFFWAITPVLLGGKYLFLPLKVHCKEKIFPSTEYVFHLGSSWVIATTTFVFRIMVIALSSKIIGGELFTAFAIGGMLSSLYTYVIGPRIISRETRAIRKIFQIVLFSCVGCGAAIILFSDAMAVMFGRSLLFFQALGFSVLASAIMMVSQRQRIILLQIRQESVFVPDVLSNVLIVAIVPLIFYTTGPAALGTLFLCNACLTYIFYSLPINIQKET